MNICIVWGKSVFWRPWETLLLAYSIPAENVYLILDGGLVPPDSLILCEAHIIETAEDLSAETLILAAGQVANHHTGRESLTQFFHPLHCTYMFGADNVSMHDRHLGNRTPDHKVYIPLPGKPELNAHTAAATFLYDRQECL